MKPSLFMLIVVGCGTWLGNPDDPDTEQGQKLVPKIDFRLPEPAGAALAGNPDDMLTGWVQRINEQVGRLNEEVERMNREYVLTTPGTLPGKGPDGRETGSFSRLGDGLYDYQVVVCVDGKVSNVTKWSEDGRRIASDRDLNQKPDAPESVRVRTVYALGADATKTLTLQFFGVPKGVPMDAGGTQLASWDEARQLADTSFTVRGVLDWFNPGETLSPAEYLTGKLSAAGEGEFVGWSVRVKDACDALPMFSEGDPASMWCNSRRIGTGAWYSQAEAAAAWNERLAPIGVAPAANLGDIVIDDACPQ